MEFKCCVIVGGTALLSVGTFVGCGIVSRRLKKRSKEIDMDIKKILNRYLDKQRKPIKLNPQNDKWYSTIQTNADQPYDSGDSMESENHYEPNFPGAVKATMTFVYTDGMWQATESDIENVADNVDWSVQDFYTMIAERLKINSYTSTRVTWNRYHLPFIRKMLNDHLIATKKHPNPQKSFDDLVKDTTPYAVIIHFEDEDLEQGDYPSFNNVWGLYSNKNNRLRYTGK